MNSNWMRMPSILLIESLLLLSKAFANNRIRIEGNTDNTGNHDLNVVLSKKRAQSVVNYLVTTYQMPQNRFIVVGNGPDKPIADNGTE